jgi:hypothetical protein
MRVWGFVLWLLPWVVFARAEKTPAPTLDGRLAYYVSLYSQVGVPTNSSDDLAAFVYKLDQKQSGFKHTADFLEYIFDKTHQKFLKNFSEYSSFPEMLNKGNYNCLTATALYALLLDRYDVGYQIIETNYHIFLVAQTDKGSILFETTDPVGGFVTNPEEIKKRIAGYRQNSIQVSGSTKTYYRYNFDLYNSVNLDQVLGLLHYNLSIAAFNGKDLILSIDHLRKAMELYQSPRFEEFSKILQLTIMEGKLDPSERERCLVLLRALRNMQSAVTASRN